MTLFLLCCKSENFGSQLWLLKTSVWGDVFRFCFVFLRIGPKIKFVKEKSVPYYQMYTNLVKMELYDLKELWKITI